MPTDHKGSFPGALRRAAALAGLVISLCALPATMTRADDTRIDYLLFADVGATHYVTANPDPRGDRNEWDPAATFIYSADGDRLRFFAELHKDTTDNEIARLQAGWQLGAQDTLWIGRFHNPQGYWSTQFHHGAYLQTSISRPGIEALDDEGGVIPSHFIGWQLEGSHPVGRESSVRFELAAGASGALTEDGLESPEILGPQRNPGPTASVRMSYSPVTGEPTSFGLFAGQNRLASDENTLPEVDQTVVGGFAASEFHATRYVAALFYLHNRLSGAATGHGQFTNAYAQAERQVTDTWTAYGRLELSSGAAGDPYLALFPQFVNRQGLLGLRWDLPHQQALKLEAARPRVGDKWLNSLAFEWSFVYP